MEKEVDVIMTKENIWKLKIIITRMFGWISNKMGIVAQILPALVVLMVLDQISGVLAAKKEETENPGNPDYRVSSRKMRVGIYKKAGYISVSYTHLDVYKRQVYLLDFTSEFRRALH